MSHPSLEQLLEAAKSGNAAEVDRLIKSGVSKEGKNSVCCSVATPGFYFYVDALQCRRPLNV